MTHVKVYSVYICKYSHFCNEIYDMLKKTLTYYNDLHWLNIGLHFEKRFVIIKIL